MERTSKGSQEYQEQEQAEQHSAHPCLYDEGKWPFGFNELAQTALEGLDWMTKAYENRENVKPLEIMQLTLEVGTKLMQTAKNAVEDQGVAVVKLLESAQITDLKLEPHLGSMIDIRG